MHDVPQFYVHLHQLLENEKITDVVLIRQCLTIIENAVKHEHMKDKLVQNYRFVQVVAKILTRFPTEKVRILTLLEEMTYGIHFPWYEYFLEGLLKNLIEMIREKSEISIQAFAILINLCFKNTDCIYIVLRFIRIEELAKLVESYGIYTQKFYVIFNLKEDSKLKHNQVLGISKEMELAFDRSDLSHLRHVVDYILTTKHLIEFPEFSESLRGIVMNVSNLKIY